MITLTAQKLLEVVCNLEEMTNKIAARQEIIKTCGADKDSCCKYAAALIGEINKVNETISIIEELVVS